VRLLLILSFFILVSPLQAKTSSCEIKRKKIVVANKTDLKEEISKNKKEGWKPEGKAIFKDWGYNQFFMKKICK
jgi:hypothetical protein